MCKFLLIMKQVKERFCFFKTCCSTNLPELHAYGAVQLHQTCLEMHGLAFRVVQVDGSALVVVSLDLTQMHAKVVAQLAELCFAGVVKAKLESCRKKTKRRLFVNRWHLMLESVHLDSYI